MEPTEEQIDDFVDYVMSFYGEGGVYEEFFEGGVTEEEVRKATNQYLKNVAKGFGNWGGGDSTDREIVRNIMFQNRGMQKTSFEKGGSMDKGKGSTNLIIHNWYNISGLPYINKNDNYRYYGRKDGGNIFISENYFEQILTDEQIGRATIMPSITKKESGGSMAKGGSVDKLWNFNDWGIKSYRQLIDEGKFSGKYKSIENAVQFDRIKYNRMRGAEQAEYVKKLNRKVTKYNLQVAGNDSSLFTVSKEIFDYANLPELPEKNYYQHHEEPTGYIWGDGGTLKDEKFYKEGSNKWGLGYTEIYIIEKEDGSAIVYDSDYDKSKGWHNIEIKKLDNLSEAKEFALDYAKKQNRYVNCCGGSMEKGGGAKGKLAKGIYRIGNPYKENKNTWAQDIAEIESDGSISTATDYARSLQTIRIHMKEYPVITKKQLQLHKSYIGSMAIGVRAGKDWGQYGEHLPEVIRLFNEHYKDRPRFKTLTEARNSAGKYGNWIIFVDSPDNNDFYTVTTFKEKWVKPKNVFGIWNELTLIEKTSNNKRMDGGSIEKGEEKIKGRGWGEYNKGKELFPADVKDLNIGDIILNETTWWGGITRNALKVTGLAEPPNKRGDIIYVEYLTHQNPGSHAIWASGFGSKIDGRFWMAKEKKSGGLTEGEVLFENGEIVWDSGNKSYGVVLNNYGGKGSFGEIRLDSDGNQPIENLHKLGSKGDKGTKEQLEDALLAHKTLVDEWKYERVNYQSGGSLKVGGVVHKYKTGEKVNLDGHEGIIESLEYSIVDGKSIPSYWVRSKTLWPDGHARNVWESSIDKQSIVMEKGGLATSDIYWIITGNYFI